MNTRGFTLIELLVGIVLVGIVGGAIYLVLLNSQRVYTLQTERAAMNQNNRAAAVILPSELRELNPTDTMESDITVMEDDRVEYKGMRSFAIVCALPVDDGEKGELVVEQQTFGLRAAGAGAFDPKTDSIVVFAEKNPATRLDNLWVHANLVEVGEAPCRTGQRGIRLVLDNVTPDSGLGDVRPGAPLRAFEMMRLLSYPDAYADLWFGAGTKEKNGAWTTQPVLGPLAASGLVLAYLDADGKPTNVPEEVARIEFTVVGQTTGPVRGSSGMAPAEAAITTAVTPRNGAKEN